VKSAGRARSAPSRTRGCTVVLIALSVGISANARPL
jgi:hypothetical protein